MSSPPLISLCMIALNEAQTIEGAIRSCMGVVDEIVVVDNGSTDGTAEIARKLGAKVIVREWTKSYADARNVSFTRASGEWVLVLDCDERLEAESAKILRDFVASSTAEAITALIITESSGGESVTRAVRIGRRYDFPVFVRRIHEQLVRPPKSLGHSPIRIRHLGHRHGNNSEKMHRYAELLELQLKETPGDFYLQLDLLHTYWVLGDPRWESAMETASASLERNAPPRHALVAVLLELAMLRDPGKAPCALSADEAARLAEKWYPNYLPLVALRVRRALANRDPQQAISLAEHAFSEAQKASVDPVPFKRQYLLADMHLLAGAAYAMARERQKAVAHFRTAQQHPEIAEIARKNLENLQASG